MRIRLLIHGSRGDFQPFLAIAIALQQAGHTVRLIEACADSFDQGYAQRHI